MGDLLVFWIVGFFLHVERLVRFLSTPVGLVVLLAVVVALGLLVRGYVQDLREERRQSRRPTSLAVIDRPIAMMLGSPLLTWNDDIGAQTRATSCADRVRS